MGESGTACLLGLVLDGGRFAVRRYEYSGSRGQRGYLLGYWSAEHVIRGNCFLLQCFKLMETNSEIWLSDGSEIRTISLKGMHRMDSHGLL